MTNVTLHTLKVETLLLPDADNHIRHIANLNLYLNFNCWFFHSYSPLAFFSQKVTNFVENYSCKKNQNHNSRKIELFQFKKTTGLKTPNPPLYAAEVVMQT